MAVIMDTEGALTRLPLKFRRIDTAGHFLYFCEDPSHTHFNLTLDQQGNLRIWHFLPVTVSQDPKSIRIRRLFRDFYAEVEITGDNVPCLNLRQDLSQVPDDQWPELVIRRIENFLILSGQVRQAFQNIAFQEVSE